MKIKQILILVLILMSCKRNTEKYESDSKLTKYFIMDDIAKAKEIASRTNKNIFIIFTIHGSSGGIDRDLFINDTIVRILNSKYIVLALHLDDRRELSSEQLKTINYNGKKTLKTIGNLNQYYLESLTQKCRIPSVVLINSENQLIDSTISNITERSLIELLQKPVNKDL